MKKVAILVPEQAVAQAVADPQYCFSAVNHILQQSGQAPLFDIHLVGKSAHIPVFPGNFEVKTDVLLHETGSYDLVVIPAMFGPPEQAVALNRQLVPWIINQFQKGAEIASLCLGAFLFAETGLLNGKKCSTHWGFADEFKRLYPEVELMDGQIVTEVNGLYSSGGANSYWNLLLHLIEKYSDRAMAIYVAKYFAIDISRNSQSAFSMFQGQKNHPDEVIKQVQALIENKVEDKITVDELAETVAIGRRSLERRFKQATNNSILEYIQRVKMEAAKRSFESSRKNIFEVMDGVGYSDPKAFRSIFKKITGLTPIEYRNKYQRN